MTVTIIYTYKKYTREKKISIIRLLIRVPVGSLGIFGFSRKKNAVSRNPVRTSDRFDNVSPGAPFSYAMCPTHTTTL